MRLSRVQSPWILLALMSSWPCFAGPPQPAFPVADVADGTASPFFDPRFFDVVGGRLYFAARTDTLGRELWRTDGTPEGTELVADLCGGACDGLGLRSEKSALFGGALYFSACAHTDCRIWKTDGDVVEPVSEGDLTDVVEWAGSLYFTTADGDLLRTHGDGSIERIRHFGDQLRPTGLFPADDALFVLVFDLSYSIMPEPTEIWRTDGTEAGTFFLGRTAGPSPVLLDGKLVFPGPDLRLWVSDSFGVEPLLEEPPFSAPEPVTAIGGVLFVYAGGRELWRTDGTPEGTFLVAESESDSGYEILRSAAYRGELYFFFGPSSPVLYRTSGLGEAAVFFEPPEPVSGLEASDETLYIGTGAFPETSAGPFPDSLWKSEGTPESTSRVFSKAPGYFDHVVSLGETLLFRLIRAPNSVALGRFAEGDLEVAVVSPEPGGASSRPTEIHRDRDSVLFQASPQYSLGVWTSDGTPEGTGLLDGNLFPEAFVELGDEVFLQTLEAVFRIGEAGGLVRVFEVPGGEALVPGVLEPAGPGLLFLTRTSTLRRNFHLWIGGRTTGEIQRIVPDLQTPSLTFSEEVETVRLDDGDVLLFVEGTLWRTDATAAGTRRILDLSELGEHRFFTEPVRVGSEVFFTSRGTFDLTPRLWRTDGTSEGTVLLRTFSPAESGAHWGLRQLVGVGDRLFFVALDPDRGEELWTSDGTEAGTVLVRRIREGGNSAPSDLTAMDVPLGGDRGGKHSRLLFAADDGIHGRELWTSDGTPEGTALFLDLFPGPRPSFAQGMKVVDGRLVFAADDGVHGLELWVSDGTRRGTRLLQDLEPGPWPSDPKEFTPAGDLVFMSAGTTEIGTELWAVERDALFEQLEASFVSNRQRAVQAKAVTFRDTSVGRPDGWCWRFGDEPEGTSGCSATAPAARHRYLVPGTYEVELTVERRLPSGLVETDRSSFEIEVVPICRRCRG